MTNQCIRNEQDNLEQRIIDSYKRPVIAEFIECMFAAFEENNIAYCVLRNYEKLPEDHGYDLDILVAPGDLSKVLRITQQLGHSLGFEKIGERKHCEQHTVCFSAIQSREKCLKIDFLQHICWKGIPCVATEYILKHTLTYKGFRIPSPGGEAVTLLIKELLAFGRINRRNNASAKIQSLAKADKHGFIECLSPHFSSETTHLLLDKSIQGCWEILKMHYRHLRWEVTYRSITHSIFSQLVHWMKFLWFHLRQRIRRPFGVFVAVIGPDGAGKTTICNAVAEYWESQFEFSRAIHVHGGFMILPRLKFLRQVWARLTGRQIKQDIDFTKKHSGSSVKPYSMIRSLGYLFYYLWDYVLGHITIFWHKGKDRLVVADRYFYDYFLHLANSKLPHWLLRYVSWFVPKPDLIILLNANPEEIYRRKDELTIDEIKRQQDVMCKIGRWLPNCIWVNTEKGISETVQQAQSAMLSAMSKRND